MLSHITGHFKKKKKKDRVSLWLQLALISICWPLKCCSYRHGAPYTVGSWRQGVIAQTGLLLLHSLSQFPKASGRAVHTGPQISTPYALCFSVSPRPGVPSFYPCLLSHLSHGALVIFPPLSSFSLVTQFNARCFLKEPALCLPLACISCRQPHNHPSHQDGVGYKVCLRPEFESQSWHWRRM